MAKAKRVFEIAKELNVDSKAIVAKCQAEGVPGITNHMSVVKLGLIETIRQWFHSDKAHAATAIETAEEVDLAKVKRPRRRKAAKAVDAHSDNEQDDSSTATATAEDEAHEEQATEDEQTHTEAQVVQTDQPQAAAQEETTATVESPSPPAVEAAPAHKPVKPPVVPKVITPVGRPNVPDRPTVVKPAGKQLEKPKEAVLRGPKVIRIEKPDEVAPPRPRRSGPGGGQGGPNFGGGPGGRNTGGDTGGITRSRGPARGRGVGGPSTDESDSSPARNKRRSTNVRRGRSAEGLPSGPTQFSEADLIELDARLKGAPGFLKQRRRDLRKRGDLSSPTAAPVVTGGKVEIAEPIFIKDLSSVTGIKAGDIIKYLFKKGIMATINSAIGAEAAMEVCMEYNIELVVKEQQTAEQKVLAEFEQREQIDVRPRPAIVTVLGHVDHGKTSLLDRIRKSDVAAHEAGGITQHVGAYRITIQGHDNQDKTAVFLDTPGHEAFTSMRARGAKMTDLVVLVVAADDGVMPQTIESINHAKAAGVPIVVALNKIDKQEATEANIRKIFGQLAEHGLNPVEWGGQTEVLKTSATSGKGVTELLEILDYQAELLDLKADYGGAARGSVIESEMQPGRGPVARVLVQEGQLKVGDFIVIGRAFGRVRDMTDDRGQTVKVAGPATPLELSGIDMIPDAGDKFYITDTLQKAEQVAKQFREAERTAQLAQKTKVTLENLADQLKAGKTQELRVVLKADVQGSIDVLRKSLEELGNEEVGVRVLHAAVGGITESDVLLADASDAVIIGFHVIAVPAVREIAEQRDIDIRLYRVIYECTDEVKKALEGMLTPESKEVELGRAEVREVFRISKLGVVAGCLVTDGTMQRSGRVRVERDGVIVTANRELESLRRVKEDAKEVRAGTECGIRLAGFEDVKIGDNIVCYKVETVKRTL
ncbi:MAG: translation initiation factor IF-2 [Phycisphaera sp.]|nr:translation initiation factor IF-2 [Phycisphaera sp.]